MGTSARCSARTRWVGCELGKDKGIWGPLRQKKLRGWRLAVQPEIQVASALTHRHRLDHGGGFGGASHIAPCSGGAERGHAHEDEVRRWHRGWAPGQGACPCSPV